MTINVENILKVADAIEQHSIAELGFNMNYEHYVSGEYDRCESLDRSGHGCGTVACIIGWTNAVFASEPLGLSETAVAHLGISVRDGDRLFWPDKERWGIRTYDDITPAQAVSTLRRLAATGEVDWSDAAPSKSKP